MHHLELDADTEQRLQDRAELLGETPEGLIRQAVTNAVRPAGGYGTSPTENLMGALVRILEDLVTENLPPVHVFERVSRIAVEQAGFRLAWVGRLDDEGWLRPEAWYGTGEAYLEGLALSDRAEREAGAGPTGQALREGRPVVVQTIQDSPEMVLWRRAAEEHGLEGSAAVPFRQGDKVAGSLQVYAPEKNFFTASILGMLEEIGGAMGTALDNYAHELERSQLVQILEATPDMVSMVDSHGHPYYYNPAGLNLFGVQSVTELTTQHLAQLKPAWAWEQAQTAIFPHVNAHGRWQGESAILDREGREIPVSQVVVALPDEESETHHYAAISRDMREQKRLQGTLTERQKVLACLQEVTGDPNTDQTRKIEELLKLGAHAFGLPYGTLSHVRGEDYRIRQATSPDGTLAADQHFPLGHTYCVHTLAANAPMGFPHVAHSTIRTRPCYPVQGTEAYLGVPVHQGETVYGTLNFSSPEPRAPFSDFEWHLLQLMGQWISDALTREADRQALERERNLFVGGPSVAFVWRLAPGWPVEHVSPNVTANFGLTPEHLQGQPFEERLHPDDRARVTEEMAYHLNRGLQGFEQEYRLLAGDGTYRWVQDFTVPDRDETGEAVSMRGYLLDITRLKEAEQSRRQMAHFHRLITMGQIGASLAHQLRQPLTAAANYAEIARMRLSPTDDDQAASVQSLDKAVEQIHHAEETIQSLRNFLNRGEAVVEPTDLNQLIRDRQSTIETLARRHGTRTEFRLAPELGLVRCDPVQITEVLLNLCRNAIEAMDHHQVVGGCLRIETEAGTHALLRICDEGGGLPDAFQEGLVQPFFTTKEDGMGLGIPIAQSLVWANDGLFGAEATGDGRGTCFWLTLPFVEEKGGTHANE